jgi:phosphotransferase system HPr-like phosphotransfer protein
LFRQRIRKNRYLDLFDGPDGNLHLGTRPTTTSSLQSLYLLNSDFMADQSRAIAKRLLSTASAHAARIRWSYENLFGRKPSADEIQMATQQLGQLEKQRYLEADADGDVAQVAWTSMIHAMLCSNEFLFID